MTEKLSYFTTSRLRHISDQFLCW